MTLHWISQPQHYVEAPTALIFIYIQSISLIFNKNILIQDTPNTFSVEKLIKVESDSLM